MSKASLFIQRRGKRESVKIQISSPSSENINKILKNSSFFGRKKILIKKRRRNNTLKSNLTQINNNSYASRWILNWLIT